MKLSDMHKLKTVDPRDVHFMAKATNPENMKFPPPGTVITLQNELSLSPPIYEKRSWEAVVGKDSEGKEYFIYPKHIKGEIQRNGTVERINILFDGSLSDFLQKMPRVKLARFSDIEQDVYNKDELRSKRYPIYELVD